MAFQSTLPRGSDNRVAYLCAPAFAFQSTLPRGSDLQRLFLSACITLFQSTLPRGSDCCSLCNKKIEWHFNPRSLAGATNFCLVNEVKLYISIHAPSRERHKTGNTIDRHRTFQSTLPRGSDHKTGNTIDRHRTFQSTLPRGSDDLFCKKGNPNANISIHAPSRERHLQSLFYFIVRNFNPRSLAGATHSWRYNCHLSLISIHAPSRERQGTVQAVPIALIISIHAPSRERLQHIDVLQAVTDFNPRSLAGATISEFFTPTGFCISIHAPSRERLP